MDTPEVRYARAGDVSIAYQVFGEGDIDLVIAHGFFSHIEVDWEWPPFARFLKRLGSFARVILFDKRGTGLSDPMEGAPTLEERVDDIRAVMDASGSERARRSGLHRVDVATVALRSEPEDGRFGDAAQRADRHPVDPPGGARSHPGPAP